MIFAATGAVITGEWIHRTGDQFGAEDVDLLHAFISAGLGLGSESGSPNQLRHSELVEIDTHELADHEGDGARSEHDQDLA